MHELGIAQSIYQTVQQEQQKQGLPTVTRIVVRVGALSDVVPDALLFNFDIIKQDTPLAQAKLTIEEVPVRARCKDCSHRFEVKRFLFVCPRCQSGQVEMLQGQELDIAYFEVED